MNDKLFVYGTLADPERQQSVLGRVCSVTKAVLRSYTRHMGRWPYLVADKDNSVEGWILIGLTECDFVALDRYEEVERKERYGAQRSLYRREQIMIETAAGGIECWLYLPNLDDWDEGWK